MNTNNDKKIRPVRKDFSLRSLFKIIGYSMDGLKYFFRYERSAILYLIYVILLVGCGIILQMSFMEWVVIAFILLTILAMELINTAIEAICDMVSPEKNPYVKIAKDCGSAATGVLTLLGWVVTTIIYLPKIIKIIAALF